MDTQPVFRALADPTRRAILEMLSAEPSAIGPIVDRFDVTRPAVAKHLRILKEGGLIYVEKKGRERINHFDASALKGAHAWISYFDQFWDAKLQKLKTSVEEDNE